jgi:hypothetical protein
MAIWYPAAALAAHGGHGAALVGDGVGDAVASIVVACVGTGWWPVAGARAHRRMWPFACQEETPNTNMSCSFVSFAYRRANRERWKMAKCLVFKT